MRYPLISTTCIGLFWDKSLGESAVLFLTIVVVPTKTLKSISESISVSWQNVPEISSLLVIASPVSLSTKYYDSKLRYGVFISLEPDCMSSSICCRSSSDGFKSTDLFSISSSLLFLIFFIAVIVWFSKLSSTNKNKTNLISCYKHVCFDLFQ